MKRTLFIVLLSLFMVTSLWGPIGSAHEHFGGGDAPGENTGYEGPPVTVTLYHHIYNLLDSVPMNTQPMDDAAPDIAQGRTMPTMQSPAGDAPVSNANNIFMFSSPGPVHYNESLDDPRYHPERGLGEDLLLDSEEPVVYWYMSADATELLIPGQGVGVMPQIEVTATLRLGDDLNSDLTQGQVVSEGSTVVDIMSTPQGDMVTEIEIPMSSPSTDIPADESFNLEVSWAQIDDGGVTFADRQWKIHTGTEFPNRMELTIENPIRMNYVHPQIIGDRQIAVHTAFTTPLGNYDVDLDKLTMEVRNDEGETVILHENGNLVEGEHVRGPVIVQRDYGHFAHHEPVLVTWVWDYEAADAPPGDYVVEASASNLQGNAIATKGAGFTLSETGEATAVDSEGHIETAQTGDTDDAPLGLAPVIASLLGALALTAHRRER